MRQTFLIVVMIFASAIAILLGIAIWPHLPLIGTIASWVASDILLCVGIVVPVATFFFLRWLWFHSSVIRRGEVVILFQGSTQRHLSAEHEAAKQQLLAPHISITEEPDQEDEELQRAKVLLYHDVGKSNVEIADLTGVMPWKVQKWVAAYKKAKPAMNGSKSINQTG